MSEELCQVCKKRPATHEEAYIMSSQCPVKLPSLLLCFECAKERYGWKDEPEDTEAAITE